MINTGSILCYLARQKVRLFKELSSSKTMKALEVRTYTAIK
jgi:hypothetical protein